MDKIELLGGACFSHGPYTFYKAVRISNGRVLRLGSFFLTKLWTDADLVSIGELQLLWIDSRGSNQPLASLRLYFLPENTPDGRRDTHGEDEVLTITEKVVVRVHDLQSWLSPALEWSWGREVAIPSVKDEIPAELLPQVLTDPGIDFSDVDKQQKEFESCTKDVKVDEDTQTKVIVLSYPRYCRYRALLRRLEGSEPSWLCSAIAAALGGFTARPGTRVLFCRDTFDYPDLETHELLCNHLAPKLKGRPRRKRKKRSVSPGESSNESEESAGSVSRESVPKSLILPETKISSPTLRRSVRKISGEEEQFMVDIQCFMTARGTPLGKSPLLGCRQIDLFSFYSKVQRLGGYESVSVARQWKLIYDEMGCNATCTSAATLTRRHYERLLLPYEMYLKGEEIKIRLPGRRARSQEALEVKTEPESPPQDVKIHVETKPKTEGKMSSLRSVRVKPERLKSLNPGQPPSPPSSTGSTTTPSPISTPSTTPTTPPSALEAPLTITPLPISPALPNAVPIAVTLTPPPEKDFREIKPTCLLAQGKENIPLPPKSPEIIDLELEDARDKIVIPSFKKRKLEILREGGLEVTAVELDRPTVIQAPVAPAAAMRTESKATLPPPKLISVTVTPDIGHMLSSSKAEAQINNNSSTAINNNGVYTSTTASAHIFAPPLPPAERLAPPRVTQSRSIFVHNEKTVYGDPAIPPRVNYAPASPTGVLDLRARAEKPRPNLEIMRVPVVPRPNLLNLDSKPTRDKDSPFGYVGMLDSRTIASNNLEITLVSPRKSQTPPAPSSPRINGVSVSPLPPSATNGRFREVPRKAVIPNVPNLSVGCFPRPPGPPEHRIDMVEVGKNGVRQDSAVRRHSMPHLPPRGFIPAVPGGPTFPGVPSAKFLPPVLDPVYYSLYNRFIAPPIPPATYISPEFSNYYKELLAHSQPRVTMGQHPVPTSK